MLPGSGFALHSSGLARPFAGQRRGWKEDTEEGGVHDEEIKMKDGVGTKTDSKSALVVKRKQLRETGGDGREWGGGGWGGDGQRKADSAEWDADGSKTPSLRFFFFFTPVWFD